MSRRGGEIAAGAAALALFALHLATSGRYGLFRDELYFLACGRHLAWGYVDQPPFIAVVARLSEAFAGGSLVLLRLFPALAHAATALLAAHVALRLSGRGFSALVAALCVAAAPALLVDGYLLTMNAFEPLLWLGAAALLLEALLRDDPRFLEPLGALLGVGLLNKFSMAFFAAALVGGLLLTRERRLLRSRSALVGLLFAAVIAAPALAWQWHAGLPQLELLRNDQLHKNAAVSLAGLAFGQLQMLGPVLLAPGLLGLWMLLRGAIAPRARALGLASLLVVLLLAALRGKAYYFAPAYPLLFAAGAVQLEALVAHPLLRALAAALPLVQLAAIAPLVLPVLSPADLVAWGKRLGFVPEHSEKKQYNDLPQHIADQFGWENLARTVAQAWESLPPAQRERAVIVGDNYGEAAALDWFGPRFGLPPALAGHNQYWGWSRARLDRGPPVEVAIFVGDSRERLLRLFSEVRLAGLAREPLAMPYESELPIWICSGPRKPLAEMWPDFRHYD